MPEKISFYERDQLTILDLPHNTVMTATQITQWREAGEKFGFFVVKVPEIQALREEIFTSSKDFFSLPDSTKNALSYRRTSQGKYGNVGYFSFGSETALGQNKADPKEFFQFGPGDDDLSRYPRNYPATPTLPEAQRFFDVSRECYDFLLGVAKIILTTLCHVYGYDASKIASTVVPSNSIMRVIRYPLGLAPKEAALAAEHVGIQLLGLQIAPNMGGLQYRLPDGRMIEPRYEQLHDCLLINIGQMGSHLLGGRISPSPHVVNWPDSANAGDRLSAVFFFHPNHDESMHSLDWPLEGNGNGKTWGDWLLERLRDLRLMD